MTTPSGDLTAKARIRNTALELFAAHGEDGTSMRSIAASAGVTVGLVVHHSGTKEHLRDAVQQRVVEMSTGAITAEPVVGSSRDVRLTRDASVARMLSDNPTVVDYLRRTLLEPGGDLLERLADLAATQVRLLQDAGVASPREGVAAQVTEILMDQLGRLFLQPLVDRTFAHLGDPARPQLHVRLDP